MKKFLMLAVILGTVSACNSQQPQQYRQTAQQGCDPNYENCGGGYDRRDSHGDALVAGVAGAGLGYAAGRMHANRINERDRGYRGYDHDDDRGYRRRNDRRTTVVNNYYGGGSTSNTPSMGTRSAPKVRTMFKSARRR